MLILVDALSIAEGSWHLADEYWPQLTKWADYLHANGQEVTGDTRDPTKSFAALDRIARQEATLAKLDATKLDACLAKQDETQVRASMKEGDKLGLDAAPSIFIDGERVIGWVPEDQLWLVIDRALRAAGEEPPPVTPKTEAPAKGAGQ